MSNHSNQLNSLVGAVRNFEKKPTEIRLQKLVFSKDEAEQRRNYHNLLGVIRHRLLLKHLISQFCAKPPKPHLNAFLLTASFQLLESKEEKTRHPKIVHFWVEQIKKALSIREAKFANAVLRKIADNLLCSLSELEKYGNFSTLHSHPQWIVNRWTDQFGSEASRDLLDWNQSLPSVYVHDFSKILSENALIQPADLGLEHTQWEDFYKWQNKPGHPLVSLTEKPLYIQDPSTRIAPGLLEKTIGGKILDACAAPGGKSVILAKILGSRIQKITAVDLSSKRTSMIKENFARLGIRNTEVAEHDWESGEPGPLATDYDAVLVDAPCSGAGIIRRHPEIRWRLKSEDYEKLPLQQLKILSATSRHVRDGGHLVYSTCSMDSAENQEVIDQFLRTEEGSDFRMISGATHLSPKTQHDGVGAFLLQKKS